MFIQRNIKPFILELLESFKIVTIAGPRQSGKTTLSKEIAKELGFSYYTMDDETILKAAKDDPITFAKQLSKTPCVIDEIQMAIELVKALKMVVDEKNRNGMFLLTGSADLFKMSAINESLAGRMVSVNLFPFSQYELQDKSDNLIDMLFSGTIADTDFKVVSVENQVDLIV